MSELESVFDRALGAYLGLAVGDALGATVEFMRPREIRAAYGVHREMVGGGWLKLARGQVTDDTTMSLALGEALLAPDALERWAHAHDDALLHGIAGSFVDWLRARPVDCGNTCRRGIRRYMLDGSLSGRRNEGDAGNGALMRNLPVVLATLQQPALCAELSLAQARLTHHHPLSDIATTSMAELTRLLLLGMPSLQWRQQVANVVKAQAAFAFDPYPGRASGFVVDTVQTVLHCITTETGFEDAVVAAVNLGDDADTNGALVGMLAGARGGASAVPRRWLARLPAGIVRSITDQASGLVALSRRLGTRSDPSSRGRP